MMANGRFKSMPTEELAAKFEAICLEQYQCIFEGKNRKYNRLFDKIIAIREELKVRNERQTLLPFLSHKNRQVRYQAAMATLLISPARAEQTLEQLRDGHEFPQAADASMVLDGLADGSFTPS